MGFRIEDPASIAESSSSFFVENGLYGIGSKGVILNKGNFGEFSDVEFWGFKGRHEYEAIAWKDEQDLEFKRSCFLSGIIVCPATHKIQNYRCTADWAINIIVQCFDY